ncbi:hypothetical protein IM538_04015 [Cytobacillus suaedae]|nr:hypothetical protein IM538_04015 [Cytobacillus suaedae]
MNIKVTILIFSTFFLLSNVSANSEDRIPSISIIKKYFNDLNEQEWVEATAWWDNESRLELVEFIANKENQKYKRGLLNIEKANLVRWKELPYEYGKQFFPSRSLEKFNNSRVYYVGVDYRVHKQNQFFIDGVNYFLVVLVLEDGIWKIALTPNVPVKSIIADGYGFGTEDEKTFDDRRLRFRIN